MLYFAYGSNLWPARLTERVPGARVVGRARLPGWRLHFHKRSDVDGSGKAGISLDIEPGSEVWGALYRLPPQEIPRLDEIEGLGVGYDKHTIEPVGDSGRPIATFTYVARAEVIDVGLRPFSWYHRFVVAGAEHHRLPTGYVESLRSVPSDPDPSAERSRLAAAILARQSLEIPAVSGVVSEAATGR